MEILIASVGLEARDEAVLRSLLRLLDSQLPDRFLTSTNPVNAQVLVVPGSWGEPALAGDRQLPQIVVRLDDRQTGRQSIEESSSLVLNRPIGVTQFAEVLRKIGERLAPKGNERVISDAPKSENNLNLFGTLAESVKAGVKLQKVIEFADGRSIMIDTQRNMVVGTLRRESLFAAMEQEVDIVAVGSAPASPIGSSESVFPLESLLWDMSHQISESLGEDKCLPPDQRYRLRRWPDSSALMREHYPRIAALLSVRTCSVDEICVASGANRVTVIRFVEAAVACGIATVEEVSAVPVESSPSHFSPRQMSMPQRSILGKLRSRLNLW